MFKYLRPVIKTIMFLANGAQCSSIPDQGNIRDATIDRVYCISFILTSISVPGLEEKAKAVGGSIDKLFSPNEHLARVVLGLSQKLCTWMNNNCFNLVISSI